MRRKHPMDHETWLEVMSRDGWSCVAPRVDPDAGQCGDVNGDPRYRLELDHVRPEVGSITSPSAKWAVALCPRHHRGLRRGSQWATAHRDWLRAYLRGIYERRTP